MTKRSATVVNRPLGSDVIQQVLKAAGPRPSINSAQADKNKYAVKFADEMATRMAADLTKNFAGISASGKRKAKAARSSKQLDVNYSTPDLGLGLGISLKSVHVGDVSNGRYTHNMKRNEEELRIEASGYHKRQPYAVMVGVLFMPMDSCDDAKGKYPSSFGSWVRHLRPYAGRERVDDDLDRFEKLYVALYDSTGKDLRFFDIESDPPKSGRPRDEGALLDSGERPRRSLTYAEFLDSLHDVYLRRNSAEFVWANGEQDPLDVSSTVDGGDEDDQ